MPRQFAPCESHPNRRADDFFIIERGFRDAPALERSQVRGFRGSADPGRVLLLLARR